MQEKCCETPRDCVCRPRREWHQIPGRILLESFGPTGPPSRYYKYEVEALDFDPQAATEWIQEGIGFDYFVQEYTDEDLSQPGIYLFEGVTVDFSVWYVEGWRHLKEVDENWEYSRCVRLARRFETLEELDDV